jgi:hypothetical protein
LQKNISIVSFILLPPIVEIEMSSKLVNLAIVSFSILAALGSALGIAALIVWDKNQHNDCVGKTDLISFPYLTWLLVFGIVVVAINGLTILLLCIYGCVANEKSDDAGLPFLYVLIALTGLASFFQLAWFVVGSILYFKEIHDHCPTGESLRDFGLALFILQCISLCCACTGVANAKKAVSV